MKIKASVGLCNLLCLLFTLFFLCPAGFAGVKGTKHDLSINGPGTIKAVAETQVCVFCHTPHNAEPAYPLWGHELTNVVNYKHYTSPSGTLASYSSEADAPPIDGISRLCLSCHDGTVALGAVIGGHGTIATTGADRRHVKGTIMPTTERYMPSNAAGYLGTDLSGGHPISIIYDNSLVGRRSKLCPSCMQLKSVPLPDKDVRLYPTQGGNGVQCASCHDPHGGKGESDAPPFWRKAKYEDVCLACHNVYDERGHGL